MYLVWEVFLEFEAPVYVEEGINTFRDFINDENQINNLEMYGAYEKGNLGGVIATRNEGSHIALFFVKNIIKLLVKNNNVNIVFMKGLLNEKN